MVWSMFAATETVHFINAKKWAKVNVYAWTTDPNASWPGAAATKEAEQIAGYDVYSFTANAGQYANVIFNDGSSQTPDLVWTAGKYYVMDMGWLTKEEAETKLAAPLPETWNIVGAAGLMGKDWDLNAAENAMTKQEDGTYKLEKKGITIVAGSYEYKAAKDHGWTVSVPQDGNQTLKITTSGIYDVTFVLNVTAKTLQATATLKQAAVVIPTVIIAGDMNSWNQTKDKFTMAADSLTATFKATLAVKNYGFKMIVGGAWHSDGKTITRAANSTKFTGANSNTNSTLKADIAGEYLFTWEYATKTLTVTYPALPVKYNVTVTAEHGTVTGAGTYEEGKTATLTATPAEGYQFVNWTKGGEVVSAENPYAFVVTENVELVANFKAVEATVYTISIEAVNGTVTGAGVYEEGATVTLTATPADGYNFKNWTVSSAEVSAENPYIFTATADVTVTANFEEIPVEYETVYFVNAQDWEKVCIYTWTPEIGTWPGKEMTKEAEQIGGKDVYSYTIEKGTTFVGLNFNNGNNGKQTGDLTWTAGKYYVIDNWYTKEEAEEKLATPVQTTYVLMGVGGDWTTGIALTKNETAEYGEEYVLLGQEIAEGDAVKVVTLVNGVAKAWCGNVDEYSVEHSADDMGNIVLAPGKYDFYFKVNDPATADDDIIYIDGEAYPEVPTALDNIDATVAPVKAIVNGQLVITKDGVQYNAQGQVVK